MQFSFLHFMIYSLRLLKTTLPISLNVHENYRIILTLVRHVFFHCLGLFTVF